MLAVSESVAAGLSLIGVEWCGLKLEVLQILAQTSPRVHFTIAMDILRTQQLAVRLVEQDAWHASPF
jgi:hypothetical protein